MICFALLAHQDEEALLDQIQNIRKYTRPDAKIVLYNGGSNGSFGKEICAHHQVQYCPYSRPLMPGKTGRFFYDVMRWLEETQEEYEYLVYTESDVMFIKHGFERLLNELMDGYDCLVYPSYKEIPLPMHRFPASTMRREWHRWKSFFQKDFFCGTFNPMQVYRHSIVKKMLDGLNTSLLENLFARTEVFALGEMLYLTLAVHADGQVRDYPSAHIEYLRHSPPIFLEDVILARQKPDVLFVHPVKYADVRKWICSQ